MGQVYRARDTRLNRDVALKVLPDSFAGDHDRLARFTREAPRRSRMRLKRRTIRGSGKILLLNPVNPEEILVMFYQKPGISR